MTELVRGDSCCEIRRKDLQFLLEENMKNEEIVSKQNENNTHKLIESVDMTFEVRDFRLKTFRKLANDPAARMKYLSKPVGFIACGAALVCAGIVLTVFHFVKEDSLSPKFKNPPYFTYGPISFASGIVVFMIGIVWFSIKHEKWVKGTASPIAQTMAAAAAIAASATLTSEQFQTVRQESLHDMSATEVA